MNAIIFRNTTFDVTDRNGQPWLRSPQIAVALGYGRADRINEVYASHADEFTDSMTAVVKLPTAGGEQETRIFSPRGCYALGMFARTKVAKEFRVWVLDVLERRIDNITISVGTPGYELPARRCALVEPRRDGCFAITLTPCKAERSQPITFPRVLGFIQSQTLDAKALTTVIKAAADRIGDVPVKRLLAQTSLPEAVKQHLKARYQLGDIKQLCADLGIHDGTAKRILGRLHQKGLSQ